MAIATYIKNNLVSSSMIRKMFEEGTRLKKQFGNDNVFDFSLGNPDVEPPSAFHKVFLKLAQEDAKGSHGYMPNAGYPYVREALAKKASVEHSVNIDGSHVVMAVGAAGGLNSVFKAILNPDNEVIVPTPYFMEYRSYISNHGGILVETPTLPDFNLDIGAIREALSSKTAAVIINSPNNPTGHIYPQQTIAELSAALTEHGEKSGRYPYLVADEPYREIAYKPVPPILCNYRESIVVSSYSKSLSLPGERIGYIAVGPQIRDKDEVISAVIYATRVLGYVNAPALMQRIVAELTHARVDVDIYARRRDLFKQVLDAAGIEYTEPEGAFYLFCKAPGGDDAAFVEKLKQNLILGVSGASFAKPGWVRFAYCVDEKIIRASAEAFKKTMEALSIVQKI
ncbi:MAG: pyridoxal phosphate-dependent aminotransferase [Treponema sp.]|jgi:aspartate aminotransferase|nr:pyridoxal phosphate-dependent aminotransferase [Treponema sp.]